MPSLTLPARIHQTGDTMFVLDATLGALAENLALDEALLLAAEAGGPEVLRLWEWPSPAVVLGAGCRFGRGCRHRGVHSRQGAHPAARQRRRHRLARPWLFSLFAYPCL